MGNIFGALYPDRVAPTRPPSHWGAETTLKLHYPKLREDEHKIANSRGSQLAVADYEMDFIKQVMAMPTARGFAPLAEVADKKYYYAVVNVEDYFKILEQRAIPMGRKHYYPLNWSHNPTEAVIFSTISRGINMNKLGGLQEEVTFD